MLRGSRRLCGLSGRRPLPWRTGRATPWRGGVAPHWAARAMSGPGYGHAPPPPPPQAPPPPPPPQAPSAPPPPPPPPSEVPPADEVVELTPANYGLFAACEIPAVLDVYADWCGPCKQVAPMMERIAKENPGRIRVFKLNADHAPEVTQQLGVTALPTIIGFFQRKIVDTIKGVPQGPRLGQFVKSLLAADPDSASRTADGGKDSGPSAHDRLEAARALLEAGDVPGAAQGFTDLVPEGGAVEAEALGGLIQCALAEQNVDAAQTLADALRKEHAEAVAASKALRTALSAVDLAVSVNEDGGGEGVAQLAAALEEAGGVSESTMSLALRVAKAQFGAGRTQECIDTLLTMIKVDRTWEQEAAHQFLLKVFDAKPDDAAVLQGRKRFSSIWFI